MKQDWSQSRREQAWHMSHTRISTPRSFPGARKTTSLGSVVTVWAVAVGIILGVLSWQM